MKQTLVMGIGNLLLSDDGIGVHAARALAEQNLPQWVTVLDVGTAFLDALPDLENAERIIIVDAIKADGPPGRIYAMAIEQCVPREMAGLHDFDIFTMLAMAENHRSVDISVVGVEPEKLDWGLELSPQVAQVMPVLLDTVCRTIGLESPRGD